MFLLIVVLFILLCVLSVFTVYKILEIEKDIDTLYDCYSEELQKITTFNLNRRSNIC